MRDINLTSRDIYGKVGFGIKSNHNSGIEIVLQKITSLLLSSNKNTYFSNIIGGNLHSVGNYNFSENGNDDFAIMLGDSILNIKNLLQQEDVTNNTVYEDRLKNITVKKILFDKKISTIVITLNVSTNTSSKTITLPVK